MIMKFIESVLSFLRSKFMTKIFVDNGTGRIKLANVFVKVKINKEKTSKIKLNGKLIFLPHFGGNARTSIILGKNSRLIVIGDFVQGDGIKIFINANAELIIGGCDSEPTSGITSNSLTHGI